MSFPTSELCCFHRKHQPVSSDIGQSGHFLNPVHLTFFNPLSQAILQRNYQLQIVPRSSTIAFEPILVRSSIQSAHHKATICTDTASPRASYRLLNLTPLSIITNPLLATCARNTSIADIYHSLTRSIYLLDQIFLAHDPFLPNIRPVPLPASKPQISAYSWYTLFCLSLSLKLLLSRLLIHGSLEPSFK